MRIIVKVSALSTKGLNVYANKKLRSMSFEFREQKIMLPKGE